MNKEKKIVAVGVGCTFMLISLSHQSINFIKINNKFTSFSINHILPPITLQLKSNKIQFHGNQRWILLNLHN